MSTAPREPALIDLMPRVAIKGRGVWPTGSASAAAPIATVGVATLPKGAPATDRLVDVGDEFVQITAMVERVLQEAGPVAIPRHYRLAKRLLDVIGAALGLLLLAPVFLLIALAIKLDSPGPVFFVQDRVGERGRRFRMIKFRSMVTGSGLLTDGPHKREDDPRVTRVGRFLRRTSLDELPQLINVLRGEMSLVGPRPELPAIVRARYAPDQYRRLLVPQGMTGWWQVTGRGKKLLCEHTEDDLYYIAHASFGFDLLILWKTIGAVLRREGAF